MVGGDISQLLQYFPFTQKFTLHFSGDILSPHPKKNHTQPTSLPVSKSWPNKVRTLSCFGHPEKNDGNTHVKIWLVVSTHLKNISHIGNLPQVGANIKKYLKSPPRNVCLSMFIQVWFISFFQLGKPLFQVNQLLVYGGMSPQALSRSPGN